MLVVGLGWVMLTVGVGSAWWECVLWVWFWNGCRVWMLRVWGDFLLTLALFALVMYQCTLHFLQVHPISQRTVRSLDFSNCLD